MLTKQQQKAFCRHADLQNILLTACMFSLSSSSYTSLDSRGVGSFHYKPLLLHLLVKQRKNHSNHLWYEEESKGVVVAQLALVVSMK